MKGTITNIAKLLNGRFQITVEVSSTNNQANDISRFNKLSTLVDVVIKKHRESRSNDANSYCWVLLDKLADKLRTTKTELYRKSIREVGVFTDFLIADIAIDDFRRLNCDGREGSQLETLRKSKKEGYSIVRLYSGSSEYNSKEMSRLINYIVDECKEQGIETATPEEIDRLIKMVKE